MTGEKKMRKIILCALVFSIFVLTINYASASTVYDPPNEVYTWQWQEYGPRVSELNFTIVKPERPPDPAQELYADSFDRNHEDWTIVGPAAHALMAVDYPDNYIESNTHCSYAGFFSFEDMAPLGEGEEIKGVTIDAYAWSDGPDIDCDIYLFGSDFDWVWAGSIEASTTWSWVFPSYIDDITTYADTPEKIANLKAVLHYWTPDGSSGPTVKIDALRVSIYTRAVETQGARALQMGDIDVLCGIYGGFPDLSFNDIIKLDQEGFTITIAPWFHYCHFGFNMRKWPFMQDATGNAFRHATAHLVPKEEIIEALFMYPWGNATERWDYLLASGQDAWLNPNIDKHPYSIDEAVSILSSAGYTFVDNTPTQGLPSSIVSAGTEDHWLAPNGTQLPVIKVFSPLHTQAPTSYTLVNMTVERMNAAGLTSVVHEPMEFATYMDMVEVDHDFDMYFCCWHLDSHPAFLYNTYHSSQDFPWGDNFDGIHDSALDAQLEVIQSSTDITEIRDAVANAQMLLSELLPRIPIYSRNIVGAFNPNLDGIVNMYGYGANNQWTVLNIHHQGIPLGATLNWGLSGEPSFLSPARTDNDYSLEVLGRIFDGLLAKNPETGELMPWIASNWNIEPWTAPGDIPGMNITFWLRDDVCWQDNNPFTAEDIKFSLEYIQQHELRELWPKNLVEVVVPPANSYVVQVYVNTSSYWLLYDIAEAATLFPKHIWESVSDPINFEPWNEDHPTEEGLSQLIGTGPFYFVEYVPGDHVLLRANPNYFKKLPTSTSEVVGSSGGTVSDVAGTASIEIPSEALTEDTNISIEQYPTSEYGGFLINQSDNIVSYGVNQFGPVGTTFETNVTITLTYNETAVDESQLEQLVVYFSDDGANWYQVAIESVDTVENTITIKVDRFSLFVILRMRPPISGVVIDEYTGQPIEGVTISVLETNASTVTDAQGRYSFDIEVGNYTLEMTVPYGYLTHDAVTKFVEVITTAEINFNLYPASWSEATIPRTIGYWKNWDKHYTPELMQAFIDDVKNASGLFSDLTIENINLYFRITRRSTMEEKGQAQLVASWLNVVSAQLGVDVQVDLSSIFGWETVIADDDGILTVDELLKQIDEYYVTDVTLPKEEWAKIKDILDALNNGQLFT